MSKTLSIFLDALRFLAALAVVVGHFTQPIFTSIWPDETVWAVAAVAVFFVLSGFVISYVVSKKEDSPFVYAVARISRIYSVLVPAIVLSTMVLLLGLKLDRAYMLTHVMQPDFNVLLQPHPVTAIAIHSLVPLTFLNSLHNTLNAMYPPLDSPIWSLGFEVAYYALFGIAVFSRGALRVVLLVVIAALVGPAVLQLFPIWLAGVFSHRLTQRIKLGAALSTILGVMCFACVAVECWRWPSYLAWSNLRHVWPLQMFLHGTASAQSSNVFYYWGLAAVLLVLGAALMERVIGPLLAPLEKPIRWCAGHTFSLYLFHYPVFVLLYVTTHYNRTSLRSVLPIFLADILLCMLLSTVSEDKKLWWRKMIARWLGLFVGPKASEQPSGS
jgi:peptidoglycan/LPS O-acetylase OafA/YrhL